MPGATTRAAAITDLLADFEKDCVVITGSHDLGFKASYANDANMGIVKGNAKLAQSYAVHVLDVFEHFRFRAVLEQQKREAILSRRRGRRRRATSDVAVYSFLGE